MLSKISIKFKTYLLGGTQLALMSLIGGIAILQMNKIGIELVDIAEVDIPLTNQITKITEHQLEQNILYERALFNAALSKQNIPNSLQQFNKLVNQWLELKNSVRTEIKEAERQVGESIDILHTEEAKKEFKHILKVLTDVEHHYEEVVKNSQRVLDTMDAASITELAEEAAEVQTLQYTLQHELVLLLDEVQKFTLAATLQAEHDEQQGILWITVSFVGALILGIMLPFIISRSIVSPLEYLTSRLAEIASGDGDLTVQLNDKAKDETGDVAREFNKFLTVLRSLINSSQHQANELTAASSQAIQSMLENIASIEKQQTETAIVATAVKQMSSATQEVADNTSHAAKMTTLVKEKITEGRQEAFETRGIIQQLSQEVNEASQVIKNLVDETNSIGNVLESIQGIAAQTNLLALNAAIEAARAGETGRGFAVVADEVRTLAQRTQSSTVDIQELLSRLKNEANNAVASMNKGTESASICLEKSEKTSQMFDDASNSISEISDLNTQIEIATGEQSVVAEEITINIIAISELAESTAKGAHSTSESNQIIAKQAVDLHKNLTAFKA